MDFIYTLTPHNVELILSLQELVRMESLDLGIYATPNQDGDATEVYIAQQPRFRDDFVLANVYDFNLDDLSWRDMTQDEIAHCEDSYAITVPRSRQICED
jgi:hypothetical protein